MPDHIEVPRRAMKIMTPIWSPPMGRRLANLRAHRGYIQSEFAEILSTGEDRIHTRQLSFIEQGRRNFMNITWAHLEKILGKDSDYVLFGTGSAKYETRLSHYDWVMLRRERGGYQRFSKTFHENKELYPRRSKRRKRSGWDAP